MFFRLLLLSTFHVYSVLFHLNFDRQKKSPAARGVAGFCKKCCSADQQRMIPPPKPGHGHGNTRSSAVLDTGRTIDSEYREQTAAAQMRRDSVCEQKIWS